jgi:hypothetical protein
MPAISARRSALLGLAAIGALGAVALGPTGAVAGESTPDAAKVASYVGDLQPNGWYCGPAATRIALSAYGHTPSFDDLANDLGTTMAGTNSIYDVTRVLNYNYGYDRYRSVEISNRGATPEQVKRLRAHVVQSITKGDPVVANIAGTVVDTIGEVHSYPGGHYLTITGYGEGGNLITITDPADRLGGNEYHLPVQDLADWIASRGYTYRAD